MNIQSKKYTRRFLRIIKRTMQIFFSILAILLIAVLFYMQQPIFGKAPEGRRLERMKQSKNFRDGKFNNRSFTPNLTKGYSMAGVMYDFSLKKYPVRFHPYWFRQLKRICIRFLLIAISWYGLVIPPITFR